MNAFDFFGKAIENPMPKLQGAVYMFSKRTDLAVEAREIWNESAEDTTKIKGVEADDYLRDGCNITKVRILDKDGEAALEKPVGTYITVEMTGISRHEPDAFKRIVAAVAAELKLLLPVDKGSALVAGLGNRYITPDAIGPLAVESVMVTRHLVDRMPDVFGTMRQVAAISPGVLGTTGMESAEVIRGVIDRAKPSMVIIVDALASRKLSRLCHTIQIADTGIVPGSGVGNARSALNKETLGVPVISIGVPTVVDAATMVSDLLESAGLQEVNPETIKDFSGGMIVTPKEIDTHVEEIARVIGYAINISLHPDLTIDDIASFLA